MENCTYINQDNCQQFFISHALSWKGQNEQKISRNEGFGAKEKAYKVQLQKEEKCFKIFQLYDFMSDYKNPKVWDQEKMYKKSLKLHEIDVAHP